ncbi:Dymeclin [Psidium guajava]|nr:Dymeclin [Psidium guajava]
MCGDSADQVTRNAFAPYNILSCQLRIQCDPHDKNSRVPDSSGAFWASPRGRSVERSFAPFQAKSFSNAVLVYPDCASTDNDAIGIIPNLSRGLGARAKRRFETLKETWP